MDFKFASRSTSIRGMMLRIMLVVFLATTCTLSVFLYFQVRSYAIDEAEKKIKNLLIEHQAINAYITEQQKPAIAKIKKDGKLYNDYFSPELLSGSYIIRYTQQYYNELRKKENLPEFYFKFAANNPRNPANKSDDFERELIKKFNAGEIKEFKQVVDKDGEKFLYYALPFAKNTQACMACHSTPDVAPKELVDRYGDKNGFGEKVGDIRAIISIRAPLSQEIAQANKTFMTTGAMILGIMLVLFAAGGWMLMRSVAKPIHRAVQGLGEAAEQVSSASNHISSASGHFAEGTSQQAAAIEETSSSLEEMASMTRQNADNAAQANKLMQETGEVVSKANESMGKLTSSMSEISKASEDTQKIIKTIDEIAFQTNLLALNAAVEAARAGEAGAGFAVVADEVRNLAMRAADAARSTASLIEGTVKKIKEGSGLVEKTNSDFSQVASSAGKIGELVGEIAAASQEQAQGIEQVNRAVSEMDKVVQQNASSAEESASASEEMSAQAGQMKGFVADLMTLVGGNGKAKRESGPIRREHIRATVTPQPSRRLPSSSGKTIGKANGGALAVSKRGAKEVRPEKMIPFNDKDYTDF